MLYYIMIYYMTIYYRIIYIYVCICICVYIISYIMYCYFVRTQTCFSNVFAWSSTVNTL